MEFIKGTENLNCPWAESAFSYGLNDQFAGKSDKNLKDHETLVMLFECASEIPNFAGSAAKFSPGHEGMGSIGFTDGHAKFLKAGDIRMRWKP